jgi:two-component system, LuxR family, response regulator FixJ
VIRRVVLIDDDAAVLESLEAVFMSADYEVQAFGLATEFLAQLETLAPACIVTDLRMPEMDGLTLVNRLKDDIGLSWPIVVISGHADVAEAVAAMRAGAVDFLTKPFAPQKLVGIVKACLDEYSRLMGPGGSEVDHAYSTLSVRERQIVELLIAGDSSKTAALSLGISPRTVDVFRGKIMRKMDVSNIAALSTAVAAVSPDIRAVRKTT